ncbi:bifunctional serine/threonine-protein kinase/ABC transporter substrate-binding protein [Streptomyces sp. DSM 44915]|uniref:Bifunctional serine/threonine-protein kinase/ABC transporter substrate-binding protein n=1 Tax=Streptomyces chisholmiae TaxID=3075540 RepID=A0ABU2JQL0_9ACTN|nr:bifunctional serine/threonine-protein kinase/ABC transporter substrate-binding protein [Streptomyces sp. DSM 44915]MDT0266498.1 bifunctional serine/threonine-protein kinase/ABC transporter substrate-binding protein [Streptomyces sp. DSM 44915]
MAYQRLQPGDPDRVGRYQVLARLGAGAMGRVYLARSPGGRPVAVKVVRPEVAEDPAFRARFAREVTAVRRVNGFFTAGVVDADPTADPPWLATAYVPGLPLGEAVAAHGPWPEAPLRALGAALAEALGAIHAAGVVHRDLKPSNVLLAGDGPRVIDFGIALDVAGPALTGTGSAVGTPGFIAPEQLRGRGARPASDVFALGAVLAHTATGAGPFGSGLVHEVNFRAAFEPAELGGVPAGLRDLVGRCLAKEPERRPDVAELVDRLGADPRGLAALDWLPAPVAHAVRERAEPPPAEPPSPAVPPPPVSPPSPSSSPAGAFGLSRRRALAVAGGLVGAAGIGALSYVLATSGDGAGPSDGDGQSKGGARTVRIAVQAPLSGDGGAVGADLVAGVRLAVELANAAGTYPHLRWEVREIDDLGQADTAVEAARTAVEDDRVLAVVGPAYTNTARAAGPHYAAAGLVAVTPLATGPDLAEPGTAAAVLRGVPSDRQTGAAIGDLLAGSPAGATAVVVDGTRYGVDLAEAAAERLPAPARAAVPPVADAALVVTGSGAASVVFGGELDQAGELARALADEGFTGALVGGDALMGRRFLSDWSDVSEGWYLVSHRFDPTVNERGRRFAERFREALGQSPGHYTARVFDLATLVIEAVGALDGEPDRAAVRAAVAAHRHEGVTGLVAFDADGEYAGAGPQLFRVRDGGFAPLGPVAEHRLES